MEHENNEIRNHYRHPQQPDSPVRRFEAAGQMNCDRIICCGDIIGIGPNPEETVREMIRIPGLIAVRGNHEG